MNSWSHRHRLSGYSKDEKTLLEVLLQNYDLTFWSEFFYKLKRQWIGGDLATLIFKQWTLQLCVSEHEQMTNITNAKRLVAATYSRQPLICYYCDTITYCVEESVDYDTGSYMLLHTRFPCFWISTMDKYNEFLMDKLEECYKKSRQRLYICGAPSEFPLIDPWKVTPCVDNPYEAYIAPYYKFPKGKTTLMDHKINTDFLATLSQEPKRKSKRENVEILIHTLKKRRIQ